MEDLSDTSFAWWQETTKDALSWYGQYSASTPLARLQLKPRPSSVLKPEWARVERRATAMMLSAVPKAIREEIIAHGQVSTLDLLCKLYSVYQPGNLQEKTLVLKMLEQPEECTSALQAVEGLRRWSLWRRRAASLGMAEPDASVLVRGLDKITGLIIKGSGELAFRVSLIRSTLQVDVSPSSSTVTTFLQHLQAEMEQQARLGASKGAADSQVALRVLNSTATDNSSSPPQPTPTTTTTTPRSPGSLCRYFASDKGCRRGNGCRYPHTWALLEKGARQKKCLCCGSTAHKVRECKCPGGGLAKGATQRTTPAGAGETGSTSPTASSPSANQRKVNFDEDGVIQAKVLRALKELQGVPLFKSVMEKVKRWTSGDGGSRGQGRPALLDSGATHVLRAPKDEEEWNEAKDVNVLLAGDSVAAMKQNDAGSLLSGDQLAQVIVPLGRVITTLGYRLCWTSEKCELIGPEGDSLPLVVKNGCPEVSERVAHHLIQQLEAQELPRLEDATQSSVKAVHGLKASWWSYLRDYVKGGSVLDGVSAVDKAEFLDFKQIVKDQMVTRRSKLGIWELLKGVNINRRARKRLLRASGWIVRWDPPSVEKTRDPHKHLAFIGSLVYVNLNTMLVENEYQNVWSVIQWGAMEGKLSAIDSLAYFMEMGLVDVSVDDFDGKRHVRLAKLSSDAAWNSAAGHQHRSTLHPMAYSLSVDVVGPLKGYGRSPDGKFFKYFVIGALRIPRVEGAHGHGEVRGHPLPPEEPEEEVLSDDEEADADPPDGAGVGLDDVDKEEKQWEDLKATFKKPLLTTTLYFAVPVNNKRAATMLPAVQKIVTDVKALGYPVTRIHSDRGGEFRGNLVRKWALASGMWPTTTSGSDSAANGVAEAGVRYLKRRARILLDSAGVDKSNWPTAVQYAAAQQRYEQLGELPPMPVAYGSKVYVKTKRYKTGAVEDFGPHWTRGRYVGPSSDIRGGHVILKESGTFIQTTHVRVTTDPPSLEEVTPTVVVEPDEPPEPPDDKPPLPPPAVPPRRVREKRPGVAKADGFYQEREQLPHELPVPGEPQEEEPQVMYMRLQEIQYVEVVAQQLCEAEKYTEKDCARLLALFAGTCGNLKVPRAPEGTGMILGAFVHGGNFGVTKYGRDLPWVTKYFNSYLMKKIEKAWPTLRCSWTTLAIQSAQQVPRHRDVHNERGTYNYVKTKTFEGLWVQGQDREPQVIAATKSREYDYEEYDGKLHEGHLIDVAKAPAVFDPLVPHAYVNEKNLKWFLSAYTPQGAYKLGAVDKDYLVSLRFPLDQVDQDDSPPCGDDVEVVPAGDCEMTMWDYEDAYPGSQDIEECVEYWASVGMHQHPRLAKLEPEYTEGIEEIIQRAVDAQELGVVERGFKRITGNEVAKLKESVDPPEESAFCKRKARIVCCGNYAAEDQGELFAGGAAAESLRCALTYTAKRRWRAGITDITGAFMLTPLPTGIGEVVYIIRPPAALVQLGLADPSERWQLTHGMYGLRQSPKLWSAFRDGEMKKMIIEDEDTSWILKQGEAEPNMWLVYETGAPVDQEPEGVILIYVDDILLCGPLRLVRALSKAIRGTWKSSELELLEADHEIRFLGCEIAVSEEYDAVFIHQRPYIEEVLRLHETREVDQSPIQAPKELVTFEAFENEEPGSPDEIKQAQRACGELLWIAQRSRPDISFVVCAMGSLLTRAAPRCLQIAARLRSYLQRTKNLALALRPVGEDFAVYTDSSFAPSGAKSHSGLVAVWSGAPVCWRSARQPFTCLSTAECELLAATEGLVMGKSIESVINQMQKVVRISLRIDNQAAVSLAKPSSSTSWQRLEELIQIWGFVDVVTQECEYCPLNEPVDILTKAYLYEEINGRCIYAG
ncbi:TY5A [Symbiodinium sp. KB8]|nr:TY5A [Symbiodinium sp. KB8]